MELPYISRAVPESSVGSLIISLARVNADATIFRCVLLKCACDSKLTLTPIKQYLTPGEILAYASSPFDFSGTYALSKVLFNVHNSISTHSKVVCLNNRLRDLG